MRTLKTAALTAAACAAVRHVLAGTGPTEGRYVRRRPLWNRGASFGLPIPRELLAPLSALALGAAWLLRRRSPLGAGLLLGGGLSNLWERLRHGRVFDYVQFPRAPGRLRRYVFNLADFAIFAGVLALLRGRR